MIWFDQVNLVGVQLCYGVFYRIYRGEILKYSLLQAVLKRNRLDPSDQRHPEGINYKLSTHDSKLGLSSNSKDKKLSRIQNKSLYKYINLQILKTFLDGEKRNESFQSLYLVIPLGKIQLKTKLLLE